VLDRGEENVLFSYEQVLYVEYNAASHQFFALHRSHLDIIPAGERPNYHAGNACWREKAIRLANDDRPILVMQHSDELILLVHQLAIGRDVVLPIAVYTLFGQQLQLYEIFLRSIQKAGRIELLQLFGHHLVLKQCFDSMIFIDLSCRSFQESPLMKMPEHFDYCAAS